jgi:hypothetical protein
MLSDKINSYVKALVMLKKVLTNSWNSSVFRSKLDVRWKIFIWKIFKKIANFEIYFLHLILDFWQFSSNFCNFLAQIVIKLFTWPVLTKSSCEKIFFHPIIFFWRNNLRFLTFKKKVNARLFDNIIIY